MEDSMDQMQYIEDSTIRLPAIKDSINSLGDLWDCHLSKPVNFNLFSKCLNGEHVWAHPIHSLDYSLTHIKSTADKIKNVNVSGNMSLELLAGIIKLEGGALYADNEASNQDEEQILCQYNHHTYAVELLSKAKKCMQKQEVEYKNKNKRKGLSMDDMVVQGLLSGKIRATHVVCTVILGGEVNAKLSFKKTKNDEHTNIEEDFIGKLAFGKMTASLKANLQWLDTEKAQNYEKRITVQTKPAMAGQPVTVKEMFELIEKVDKCIENEKHFKFLSDNITGAPVGFIVVPISQFLREVKVEKLYFQLEDTVLNDFKEMLINLHDFRSSGYLKRWMLDREPNLRHIISDSQAPLSKEIQNYEETMNETAEEYFERAYNELNNFKNGLVKGDTLLNIIDDFRSCNHNVTAIFNQVENFLSKGKRELIDKHYVQSEDINNDIRIFHSMDLVDEWMRPETGIKILITTNGMPLEGTFRRLYSIRLALKNLGIKVGIASPSISNNFSLHLKVNERLKIYLAQDVLLILQIISAAIGVGGKEMKNLFYSLNASLFKIALPIKAEQLRDLDKAVEILKINHSVYIAESPIDTLEKLKCKDNKWRFFLSMECIDTALDAVGKFRVMGEDLKMMKGEWIVGGLGIRGHHSAPILFVIRNGKVEAICFDNVDLFLLVNIFKQNNKEPNFKILSTESLCDSFYPDRCSYAQEVVKSLHQIKTLQLDSADYQMTSFDEKPDNMLIEALDITRSAVLADNHGAISFVARMALKQHPELEVTLTEHGWNKECNGFSLKAMNSELWIGLFKSFQKWMMQNYPLMAKAVTAKLAIGLHQQSLTSDGTFETTEDAARTAIDDILWDNRFQDIIDQIEAAKDNNSKNWCRDIASILSDFIYKSLTGSEMESIHVTSLILLLHQLSGNKVDVTLDIYEILPFYVKRISPIVARFQDVEQRINDYVTTRQSFSLLSLLSKCQYDSRLFLLHERLDEMTSLESEEIIKLLELFSVETLNAQQWADLWKISKFVYIIRERIGDQRVIQLIAAFERRIGSKVVPDYIPKDVGELVKDQWDEEEDLVLPELFSDLHEMTKYLRRIVRIGNVPTDFNAVLSNSLVSNGSLRIALQEAEALFYWNSELVTEPWHLDTMKSALERIDRLNAEPRDNTYSTENIEIVVGIDPKELNNRDINDQKEKVNICDNLESILGKSIDFISSPNFIKVREICDHPKILEQEMEGCVKNVLMYVLQNLKMWGCNALQPGNINRLILNNDTVTTEKGSSVRPQFVKNRKRNTPSKVELDGKGCVKSLTIPLSRIDIIAALFSIMDSKDARDILSVMSFFPIALPLVISDIEKEEKFKVLLPWLLGVTIKWESTPGVIVENSLFTSPFRMIVAVRLGRNKRGKSTILNQILSKRHIFSSYGEPGAERGPPLTLNGTVEFTWLTQETCESGLWETVVQRHYGVAGRNELLILANLHGDALEHKETIQFLNQLASSYIVFLMPDTSGKMEEQWESFEEIVADKKIDFLYVDPIQDMENNVRTIETALLTEDTTLEKVRNVIKDASNTISMTVQLKDIKVGNSLKMAEICETKESHDFIEFVSKHSCQTTKSQMQLQKVHLPQKRNFQMWQENEHLQQLLSLFCKVMSLPLQERRNALAHIEQDLSRLFRAESIEARVNIARLKEEYLRTIGIEDQNPVVVTRLRGQIAESMELVDSMNLGLEHLFRELGHLYEMAILNSSSKINKGVIWIPTLYADMFINGHAIEFLDGDAGEIPCAWFNAIGDEVHRRFPNLRVYVISILGLQSSGKSTLLNALFACNFAVSVGRCSRGLFMHLLFLEESLSDKLKVDALVLIDSEGLGAPEKANNVDAEEKDRLLATFAMSVSDLTLINVLGESMQSLTEILQIAIIAIARLNQVEMAPDILMVQHLTERNKDKTSNAAEQFRKALQSAMELTEKKDIAMGIRNSKSLKNLMKRVNEGDILKQFRPFKNGASAYAPPSEQYHEDIVDLYNIILKRCQQHSGKVMFKAWYQQVQSYWAAVSNENFAVRFKNVKEVYEFIDRGERIANVKESVDITFRKHSQELEAMIRKGVQEALSQDNSRTNVMDINVRENLIQQSKNVLNIIPNMCSDSINGEAKPCQQCADVIGFRTALYTHVEGSDYDHQVKTTINLYIKNVRQAKLITLMQMLDAEISRQGYSAEFMLEINTRLKKILEERKDDAKNINEDERNEITDEIWKTIIRVASTKINVVSLERKINEELISEYGEMSPFVIEQFYAGNLPHLHELTAYTNLKYLKKKLDQCKVTFIQRKLDDMADVVLKQTSASHFQSGMIADLRVRVNKVLEIFQNDSRIKFTAKFKWNCHVYALLKFYEIMQKVQDKWEKSNHPLKILENREADLKKMINTRLQYGFSSDSEGRIVAENLLKAVCITAKKSGDEYRRDYVLGLTWMLNSENVRLRYFSKLAEEVNSARFDLALKHFEDPKYKITKWFIGKVNEKGDGKELQRFYTTFDAELQRVIQEIRDKKTIQDIHKFITDFLSKASNLAFKLEIDIENMMDADFELFQNSILNILSDNNSVRRHRDNVEFNMPSEDEVVMGRLGCTESCHWCGAICWGQRGHHENADDTRKHHSCHQPCGLVGTRIINTLKLNVVSCHEWDDDAPMTWDGGKTLTPWRDTKLHEKFNSWKYDSHCKNEFNEMMCWFFFKLHKAIANYYSLMPAPEDHRKMKSWQNLDYDKIMSTIKQKIN